MLILAGFALAVLPLIFALINNAISIHELATKSQRAVFNAVQVTQSSRLLIEQITGMERSARQFSILADPELYSLFETAHRDFVETARRMQTLDLLPGQLSILKQMVEVENRLFASVAALRQQPRLVVDLADDYSELGRLARALDATGREAVGREIAAMQALSGEVHTFIYWQLVALIPVALFLVIGRDHPDPQADPPDRGGAEAARRRRFPPSRERVRARRTWRTWDGRSTGCACA